MKECEFCGKPTESHTAGDVSVCHSCFVENEDIARSLLAEAEGEEDDEVDEIFEQLPQHETEDAYYVDMTPIHDAFRENIKEKREQTPPPTDIIQQLRDLLSTADTRQIICSLGENFVMSSTIAVDPETHKDGVGIPPKMMEYLLGLLCTIDPSDSDGVPYEEIHETTDTLTQSLILHLVDDETGIKSLPEEQQHQHFIEAEVLTRELTAGRFVYPSQYLEAAKRAYTPHDEILQDEVGFTIQEAIQISKSLTETYNERYQQVIDKFGELSRLSHLAHGAMIRYTEQYDDEEEGMEAYLASDEIKDAKQKISKTGEEYQEAKRNLWIEKSTLFEECSDEEQPLENFLNRMSVSLGSVRESDFTFPYEHNPIHESPILEHNGEYIIPHFNAFYRALAETYYYDLISHPEYGSQDEHGGEFGQKWGNYVEEWGQDSLLKLFPEEDVFMNPEYTINGDRYESDIVILHNETCIVIECKTQKLTLPTRRGDYQKVRDDVLSGIGEGHDQASRFINNLQNGEVTEITTNNGTVSVDGTSINQYLPIILLREQYDWIGTTEYGSITNISNNLPYVASVYDLEVICECLNSPERFSDYIEKRIEVSRAQKLASPDELDYLGAYLDNGLEVLDMQDDIRVNTVDFAHIVEEKVGEHFYNPELSGGQLSFNESGDR